MAPDGEDAEPWLSIPDLFRRVDAPLPAPWSALFGSLRRGTADELVVIGQLGQSLDGRVATVSGHSHYINGLDGLRHLHRLRALVDAVVVGVGTAVADDPQLTVRRVTGPNPARVVIDPRGRLPRTARLLQDDGTRRLIITSSGTHPVDDPEVEILKVPSKDGRMAPAAILLQLADRGFRRILIEGGAETVSRFLAARCLDRLHVVVAPIILGAGRASVALPPIQTVGEALRPRVYTHLLGDEVLFDCDLSAQRLSAGEAKKSR